VILAFVEHDDGRPIDVSLEAVTFGRGLAERFGTQLHAVVVGEGAAAAAEGLRAFGVAAVRVVADERLDAYAPAGWARGVAEMAEAAETFAVVAAGTERGNEVMAHVAAMLDLPMAANCVAAVRIGDGSDGGAWRFTRQRWGGSLLEDTDLSGRCKLLTLAPHTVPAEEAATPASPSLEPVTPSLTDTDLAVRVTGRVAAGGGGVSLADANVVIGGGRGVGGADGFAELEQLAELLGGAVGCSRVATSLGWRPHSDQVGQTGTRIAPDLYVACGISGAMQHIVGCKGAKHVLAINTDPEAPMVTRADWAVIGDLHAILPALVAAVREARAAPPSS
jgi:electron transfer flavoprotein alpha subunit